MKFKFTLEAIIEVPEGSQLVGDDEQGFEPCIILPTGERINVDTFIVQRKLHPDGYVEDTHPACDIEELGVHYLEGSISEPEQVFDDPDSIEAILAGIK